MATAKKENSKWDMVEIYIPFDKNETDDLYVSVAGVGSYLIKRGSSVTVPEPIAEILKNSMQLEEQNARREQQMENEFFKRSRE